MLPVTHTKKFYLKNYVKQMKFREQREVQENKSSLTLIPRDNHCGSIFKYYIPGFFLSTSKD